MRHDLQLESLRGTIKNATYRRYVIYGVATQNSKCHLRRKMFYAHLVAGLPKLKPSRIALSTPCSRAARLLRPPCSASRHQWRGGRQGWVHSAELVLRAKLCGSGGRGTIYLAYRALAECSGLRDNNVPLRMSRQIRPSLSDRRLRISGLVSTFNMSRTDIWMVDLGQESYFGRGHRVLFWEEELKAKHPICKAHICEILYNMKPNDTYSEMDCRLVPGWLRRSTAGCLHEVLL